MQVSGEAKRDQEAGALVIGKQSGNCAIEPLYCVLDGVSRLLHSLLSEDVAWLPSEADDLQKNRDKPGSCKKQVWTSFVG